MSGNAPEGTGFVGILTPDQTKSLKQLWVALEEIQEKGTVTIVHSPAPVDPASAATASSGWGGGWFGASKEPAVEKPTTLTLSEFDLNAVELKKMLWDTVLGDNPDALVLRFLRARKWHVANGLTMLLNAYKWRKEQNVEDVKLLSEDELDVKYPQLKRQLEMGKFFIHGKDKLGRPIVYLNVHLHKPAAQDAKTLECMTIYLMETGRLLLEAPVECVTLVFDLSQFGVGNMDMGLVQFLVKCFEAYYPESLGIILVHNAPMVFWGFWKIINVWLDPVVAAKVRFTYKPQELAEDIDADHLLDTFKGAGLDKFKYEYLGPVPGENDSMKDEATKATLLGEWSALIAKYNANTKAWVKSEDSTIQAERDAIAKELHTHYYKMQPYIRAKTQFHRKDSAGNSVIQPDGSVKWTYTH
ncbi:hypothetical protein BGX27_010796 [Mortierella sp. AM989]|nr:hypothetical protein BGX27_010796 [Mortierella sp. AM989]